MMIGLPGPSGTEEGTQPTHAQEDALLRTQAVRRTNLLAQHTDFSNFYCPHANGEIRKNVHIKYQKQTYNDRMRTTQAVSRTYLLAQTEISLTTTIPM